MKNLLKALVAVCAMSMASGVSATVIASFDFEDGNTTGWSTSSITTAPLGERFLGRFNTANIGYGLSGIDTYDVLSVTFDFYVIGSWDGNGRGEFGQYGPDTFAFTMNGQTLLNETFNNQYSGTEYPASNTEDPIATNTLGYFGCSNCGRVTGLPLDWTYRFNFTTTDYSESLSLQFAASLAEGIADESWGLDNVIIETSVASEVPEPTTTALLALGLIGAGLGFRRRRVSSSL